GLGLLDRRVVGAPEHEVLIEPADALPQIAGHHEAPAREVLPVLESRLRTGELGLARLGVARRRHQWVTNLEQGVEPPVTKLEVRVGDHHPRRPAGPYAVVGELL